MKDEIIKKLMVGKKWYQKAIIRLFGDTIVNIYRQGMVDNFNYFNK